MHVRSKKEEVNFTDYKQLKCNNFIEENSRNLSKYNTRNSIFSSPPPLPLGFSTSIYALFFILLIRSMLYFVLEHNMHLIFGCETCGNYLLTNDSITRQTILLHLQKILTIFQLTQFRFKKKNKGVARKTGDNAKIEMNTTEESKIAQNERTAVDISLVLMEKLETSIGQSLVRPRRHCSNPLPLHLKQRLKFLTRKERNQTKRNETT